MQVTQRMPDKDIQTLREIVAPVAKGVWFLVFFGFIYGGWVTTIEFRTQANKEAIAAVQAELKEREKREVIMEGRIATIEANSKTTAAGVTRIEGILLGRK